MTLGTTRVVHSTTTWRTVADLASLCGETKAEVFAKVVAGLLGDGRVNEETNAFEVAPDAAAISLHFPKYGVRCAAATKGWPVKDTAELYGLAAETKVKLATLLTRAEARSGVAYDGSRTRYVRRSDVVRDTPNFVALAIHALPPRERSRLLELDPARWYGPGQAIRRTKATWEDIAAVTPAIEYRKGQWSAWISDETLAHFAQQSLERAIVLDEHSREMALPVSEFHELRTAVKAFEKYNLPPVNVWNTRRANGRIHSLTALFPVNDVLCLRPFVHIPAAVWESTSRRVARKWFYAHDQHPLPDERSKGVDLV